MLGKEAVSRLRIQHIGRDGRKGPIWTQVRDSVGWQKWRYLWDNLRDSNFNILSIKDVIQEELNAKT